MAYKKGNVSIGHISGVREGTVNITPGHGRGSGRVHVGNIDNVSGGQINIAGGDIFASWGSGDPPKRKRKGKKKKKGGFLAWLFGE